MRILDNLVNKSLKLDPDLLSKLIALKGKQLAIQISDLNQRIYITITDEGLSLSRTEAQSPDTTMTGSLFSLMKMSFSSNMDALKALQNNDIEIVGDVEFGLQMKKIFQDMHIDWEEHLSYFTGDVIAHQLGNLAKGSKEWLAARHQSMQENIREYVQEEASLSPSFAEFDEWQEGIRDVQTAYDRLQARWQRLVKKDDHA